MLDVAYESKIVKMYFTDVLEESIVQISTGDNLTSDLQKLKVSNSMTRARTLDFTYYPKYEVENLLKGLIAFGLKNINTIEEDISTAFTQLNNIYEGDKTRLEVVYNSNILKLVITDKLDEIINDNDFIVNHPDSKEQFSVNSNNLTTVKFSEIKSIVDLLEILEVTDIDSLSSISTDNVEITELQESLYNTYNNEWNSKIILATVSDKILELESDKIIVPQSSYYQVNSNGTFVNIIYDAQIYQLLNFIKELCGENDTYKVKIGDLGNVESKIKNASFDSVRKYLEVDVLQATVSKFIIDFVENVPEIAFDQEYQYSDVKMISIGELNLLLDALNEVGINNVDTSNMDSKLYNEFASLNDNSLKFNDKTKLQVIYTSSIAKSLITEKVDEQFNSESNKDILQNHDAAKLNGIYKVEEISALCTLLSSMGDGSTLDNINVNNLKISSIKQFFNVDNGTASCSSYLVLSTVSINIHNLSISKPTSIYTTNTLKYKIISENEIVSLLNFVLTLNEDATVGSLSSITNNIDNTNISTITSSLDSKIILSI